MIRLAIADDHPIVREGLKHLIANSHDMQLVAEAVKGQEIIPMLKKNNIDVLLLDISMPGSNFLDVLHRIQHEIEGVRVLVLSLHKEEQYALRAYKAGASGYLTKDRTSGELIKAIRHIYKGKQYITPTFAEQLLDSHKKEESALHDQLTNREYEILCMLVKGQRTTDIAHNLSLSPKTISTHKKNILSKLKKKTTSELIRYAMEQNIS